MRSYPRAFSRVSNAYHSALDECMGLTKHCEYYKSEYDSSVRLVVRDTSASAFCDALVQVLMFRGGLARPAMQFT